MKQLTGDDVATRATAIAPHIYRTPLLRSLELELLLGRQVFYKCENLQLTGSYKVRGAFNALLALDAEQQSRGVITRSAGNFAQALAYAGQKLGVRVTIIMPETSPIKKREGTARFNPELIIHGRTHQESQAKVLELAASSGQVVLSPFDHPDVILGQGSIAVEILEETSDIDTFLCPIGGGGILGGCSLFIKSRRPSIRVVAVEPEGAADFALSMQRNERTSIYAPDTIADGLRAPIVGEHNWPILRACVDEVVTVSDQEIREAMRFLFDKEGFIIEPSGAVTVAALLSGKVSTPSCVAVLTGRNVDWNGTA